MISYSKYSNQSIFKLMSVALPFIVILLNHGLNYTEVLHQLFSKKCEAARRSLRTSRQRHQPDIPPILFISATYIYHQLPITATQKRICLDKLVMTPQGLSTNTHQHMKGPLASIIILLYHTQHIYHPCSIVQRCRGDPGGQLIWLRGWGFFSAKDFFNGSG